MNRFLAFFLVSFLLHLTVGAFLLSRSGVLGGKGVESTELTDLEEVSMEASPSGETETEILEKKVKKIKSPPLPKPKPKKKRKKKPVKTPSASSPLKKQAPPVTKPPIVSEPAKTKSDGKEREETVSKQKPDQGESEEVPEKTLEKKKETKEEWVDESEIVPPPTSSAPPEKAEPKEEKEAPRDVKKQESQGELKEPKASPPIEGEEKKPDENQKPSVPPPGAQMEKSEVPSLDVGAARMHNQLKQLEGNPLPVYPKEALKKRWEGRAEIFYYVNRAGFVEKIQLKNSSGHSALDNAALRALSRYRYYPGQEGWVKHPVEFLLDLSKEVKEIAPLGTSTPPPQ
ncbi:MAG: TonB family protein [Bdellovibrionales bacterium]|nr:TonB family protein [Bdellovibrionales bacterium]